MDHESMLGLLSGSNAAFGCIIPLLGRTLLDSPCQRTHDRLDPFSGAVRGRRLEAFWQAISALGGDVLRSLPVFGGMGLWHCRTVILGYLHPRTERNSYRLPPRRRAGLCYAECL